jgi:hypothetical protein
MHTAQRASIRLPIVGCLMQYVGFQWDIAWHILIGRDSFWLPPHWMVYFGVALVLTSGLFPIWRGRGQAPLGSYLLAVSALAQISAAPIDDLWHRLYGIDNTLWSPPHLAFILSGSLTPLALILLLRDRDLFDAPPARGWLDSTLILSWRPRQLLRNPSLILCGLALAWLDFTLTEFRFHVPPQIFPWDFALFPPLMIAIVLLAGFIGLVITGLVGSISLVSLSFTVVAMLVNLELMLVFVAPLGMLDFDWFASGLLGIQSVPMLIPSAIAADLTIARLTQLQLLPRAVVASLIFAALFYAVQFPYSQLTPPAWQAELLGGVPLALWLSPLAAIVGLLVGRTLERARALRYGILRCRHLTARYSQRGA